MKKISRYIKFDGLRGFLCLMILLLHIEKELLPKVLFNNFFIRESYVFVDFFFVLSGFVITLNYYHIVDSKGLVSFIKKRIIRLYPLLIYSTTIFFLWILVRDYYATIDPSLFVKVKGEPFYFNLQKFFDTIFFTNSIKIFGDTNGINYPSWSISAEMISYLVFGVLSFVFTSIRKYVLILVTILGMLFCLYTEVYFYTSDFGFVRGLICFSSGSLAYEFLNINNNSKQLNSYFETLMFILLLLLMYGMYQIYPGFDFNFEILSKQLAGILLPLFFGIFIYVLAQTNSFLSKILQSNFLVFLGKISYSIYLNHALLIIIVPKFIFRIVKIPITTLNQIIVAIITIIATIIYSNLTYKYIENFSRKVFKK